MEIIFTCRHFLYREFQLLYKEGGDISQKKIQSM